MKKSSLILIVVCIILLGVLAYFYFEFKPEEVQYYNVSISAEYENNKIKTGFKINPIGITGNTSSSYEFYEIQEGVIWIENFNINNQKYYINAKEYNITKNTRIDLILTKPEKVDYKIEENEIINITLYSKNFKEIDFCLSASFNYYFVRAKDYKETNKYEDENYDACYIGNFSLLDNYKSIEIGYKQFETPDRNDFINLILIDKAGNREEIKIK